MISTLHKYPWFATTHITLEQRNNIFNATVAVIRALAHQINRNSDPVHLTNVHLTNVLLQELVCAALTCPGFSEAQKYSIVFDLERLTFPAMAPSIGYIALPGESARSWPFETLGRKPGVQFCVLEYYASLLAATSQLADAVANIHRDAFVPRLPTSYYSDQVRMNATHGAYRAMDMQQVIETNGQEDLPNQHLGPFGSFMVYYGRHPSQKGKVTLADAATAELEAVHHLLTRFLGE